MKPTTDNADRITQRRAKRKKKQEKKKKHRIIKGIAAAIFLYLAICIAVSFYSGMTTTIALKGTVEENVVADGYVFRKQSLVYAPAAGYLECRVSEGERVKQGQVLGYIYTGEYDAERFRKIREISEEIEQMESNLTASTYAASGVMVEQKIGVASRDLSDQRQQRDMGNTAEQKEEIDRLIERKNVMNSGNDNNTQVAIEDLKNQLWALERETGGSKHAIVAPASGVFSSKIDGIEEELSVDRLTNLTPEYLQALDKKELQRKETVEENEPVCKVVDNYGWHFATNLKAKEAEGLSIGQSVQLRFFDLSDAEIEATIKTISEEENGMVAVSIYTNRYVEGVYASSRATAEMITTHAEGIKLPVQSIHVKDGQPGVYVLRLDVARFVPINIRYKNDTWAIVSATEDFGLEYKLQIYDEVIVEAKNLEDGKVVR